MSAKKAKAKEAEEAAAQIKLQELKALRTAYAANCKKFITEPIATLAKKIDKSIQGAEELDKVLQLVDCGLTKADAESLATICNSAKVLDTLMLDHNQIGSSGMILICEGLSRNPASVLSRLSMRFCDIGSKAANAIANCLTVNTSLTEIDISYNRIGDEGVIPIAKALASSKTLKILRLAVNQITDKENALNISAGTITGVLKVLDVNTQQVVKAPVTAEITAIGLLCASLATENNGLTFLDLRGNHIGQRGGECVLEMMKARRQLAAAKRAEPLKVQVTERMSGDLFEDILDMNDMMEDIIKKSSKKGGKKKGGKKNMKEGISDHQRDPCPYVIVYDIGVGFAMGSIGGSIWHGFKGYRNSPRGERFPGALASIKARAPVLGGNFAVWSGLFNASDCTLAYLRGKEDSWNAIIAGAATGGILAARSGPKTIAISAAFGGIFLAIMEGLGSMIGRMSSDQYKNVPPPLPPDVQAQEKPSNSSPAIKEQPSITSETEPLQAAFPSKSKSFSPGSIGPKAAVPPATAAGAKKPKKKSQNDIWDEDEIEATADIADTREQPKYSPALQIPLTL
ncbi:Mitochondrial import inner membrane translocase subunit Tim17-A [Phlyctochytrium bullatum]|nr:Mitochondrial import inner membrane translocase subunit Tim17-A [Phlyctochytrium bullatum]